MAIDAKYRNKFGDGGVVMSKNLVNNILNELGKYLSWGIQFFIVPKNKKLLKFEFINFLFIKQKKKKK